MDRETHIQIGEIYREHGIQGYCKVYGYEASSACLEEGKRCLLVSSAGEERETTIEDVKVFNRYLLVKFDLFRVPEAIAPWRKAGIWVDREQLPRSKGKDLFDYEWTGYQIVDPSGKVLGRVIRIEYNPLRHFIVDRGAGQDGQIPYTLDWFVKLDKKKKVLTLDVPEGLLDL